MTEVIKKSTLTMLRVPVVLCLVWVAVWVGVFSESLESVYSVWMNSNTYTHCIFVVPITLYFIYQNRVEILSLPPRPSYVVLVPMLLLQGLWLLGFAADIELFKHAAVFGMLSSFVVLLFGWQIAKVVWFPLVFIVFSIPVGEELVPSFQIITADLTVFFLQLSGVAVFRDGLFITIPAGMFEVAEACSGIRFFVACVVMGAVIAYTSYHTIWKRILFFVFSMTLPIVANGLRAYGTILVAHLVDIKYATGADHLIYGWGFFALVVLILVAFSRIGSEPSKVFAGSDSIHLEWLSVRWYPAALVAVLPLFLSLFVSSSAVKDSSYLAFDKRFQPGNTVYITARTDWMPVFSRPKFEHLGVSTEGVAYYIAGYDTNEPGAELVSEKNRLFDIGKWRYNGNQSLAVSRVGGEEFQASLLEIGASTGGKRLVLYWYYLPNISSSNSLYVKLFQAFNVLLREGAVGAVIALSVPVDSDMETAKHKLLSFANLNSEQLESLVLFN
ncbi:hypothetical protein A9Q81_11425 [Gammaproteobacteria bacterium 42_54_T18]|nr:hypothetical protein A9Q81_11425 [Gammaproteobacteria bacterium 42_54_T18]